MIVNQFFSQNGPLILRLITESALHLERDVLDSIDDTVADGDEKLTAVLISDLDFLDAQQVAALGMAGLSLQSVDLVAKVAVFVPHQLVTNSPPAYPVPAPSLSSTPNGNTGVVGPNNTGTIGQVDRQISPDSLALATDPANTETDPGQRCTPPSNSIMPAYQPGQ